MISFFLERTRRKVRSFWGSMSRTQLRACAARLCSSPAYCTVVELSIVVRTGIPAKQHTKVKSAILQKGHRLAAYLSFYGHRARSHHWFCDLWCKANATTDLRSPSQPTIPTTLQNSFSLTFRDKLNNFFLTNLFMQNTNVSFQ